MNNFEKRIVDLSAKYDDEPSLKPPLELIPATTQHAVVESADARLESIFLIDAS